MSEAAAAAAKAKDIIKAELDDIVREFSVRPWLASAFKDRILRLGIAATMAGVEHTEEITRIKAA